MKTPSPQITISTGPLFLVFLVLKLTKTVDWSWTWVTAPLWIPLAFICVFLALGLCFAILSAFLK